MGNLQSLANLKVQELRRQGLASQAAAHRPDKRRTLAWLAPLRRLRKALQGPASDQPTAPCGPEWV